MKLPILFSLLALGVVSEHADWDTLRELHFLAELDTTRTTISPADVKVSHASTLSDASSGVVAKQPRTSVANGRDRRNGRDLQVDTGLYEIAEAIAEYDTGTTSLWVIVEHDDVTGFNGDPSYGSRSVSHYEGGCSAVVSSSLGEVVASPDSLSNAPLTTTPTATLLNSVQTTITYSMSSLDALSDPIKTVSGATTTVSFCVRLSLLDTFGREQGYRETDIDLEYPNSDFTSVTVSIVDNNPGDSTLGFGSYTVLTELCTAQIAPLAQGENFEVCMTPLKDGSPTTEIELSVDDFVFFLDDIVANDRVDSGETHQYAIQNGAVVAPATMAYSCLAGASGVAGVHGCVFTTTLRTSFFASEVQTVKGQGVTAVTFDKALLQVGGRQFKVSGASFQIELQGETTEESCFDGCYVPFCLFRWIFCLLRYLFGLLF